MPRAISSAPATSPAAACALATAVRAQALGLNLMVVAELLPELEAVMVRRINEKIGDSDG